MSRFWVKQIIFHNGRGGHSSYQLKALIEPRPTSFKQKRILPVPLSLSCNTSLGLQPGGLTYKFSMCQASTIAWANSLKSVSLFISLWACMLSLFSCVQLFATLWTVAHQAPLPMRLSRQEYWSGLPCPPPENLPCPGIEPASLMSPAQAGKFFTTSATWEAYIYISYCLCFSRESQLVS